MSNKRVLIVCEQRSLATALTRTFETSGFDVRTALSANEGGAIAREFLPALVVVDVDLPAADRIDFYWKLRGSSLATHLRIMMLSDVRGELMELLHWADDYLLKPIQFEHLMYRVAVLLNQKTTRQRVQLPIRRNGLELDFDRRIARLDGIDLYLTATEFRLLWVMALNPDIVLSRQELVNQCRGCDANCSERTIDVHIRSVRRKLGRSSSLVETVRGVGYCFRDACAPSTFEHEVDQDSDSNHELADRVESTSVSIAAQLAAT